MKKRIAAIAVLLILSGCKAETADEPVFAQAPMQTETASPVPSPGQTPAGDTDAVQASPLVAEMESATPFWDIERVGDDLPVSRGLVAKMLSLAYVSKSRIDGLPRFIEFTDTAADKWYDRYINSAVSDGLMSGGGSEFYPDAPLTLGQAQLLLDKLDPNNEIKMVINDENRGKPISYELWVDLYYRLLESLSGDKTVAEYFGISADDIVVMITPETFPSLKPYNMITDGGALAYAGYSFEQYIDKSVRVLKKDGEVVAVLGIESETPTIYNALIVGKTDETITVFSGGAERTYAFKAELPVDITGETICDIVISGKSALKVTAYAQKITGTIVKVAPDYIELAEYGRFDTSGQFKVYSTESGKAAWKVRSNLTVGTDISQYVMNDGKIIAAVITKAAAPGNIRVAISKTGFTGYVHDSVSLTGTTDFTVTDGGNVTTYKAGEVYTLTPKAGNNYHRVIVAPVDKNGKIQINSVKKNWPDSKPPQYRGIIELIAEGSGYTIVNELTLEQYLYAVVPSEIPTSFGLEALKVQAITARSYAYNQFHANRYARYGANVDDSVNCQVYNNIPENATSISAVDETAGQFLAYKGSIVSANFFSTSAGVTANSGEVWAVNGQAFPGNTPEYLSSVKQHTGDYGDLSSEENATRFFKDTTVKTYDSGFSWFRWNVSMTVKELEAAINNNLKARYNASPNLITTLTAGTYRSMPLETVGALKDIEVVSRGEAGNILKLKITGAEATVMVETEYNIRMLLTPAQSIPGGRDIMTNRLNASPVSNYSLMPSAFFVFEKTYDASGGLSGFTFYGGGNGHGVGMSQNGVKGMIDAGFNCEQILKHYYKGTEIVKR